MRADLLDEIELLEKQARDERENDKRENRDPVAPQIAAKIQALEEELAASEVAFTFQAIGGRPLAKLIADNPPTDEQKASAEEQGMRAVRNDETFQPALLQASCVAPEGSTVEDWTAICDTWSLGQFTPLWEACLVANFGAADVGPKSLIASEILRGSGTNSTTAPL
jgi:hypothetical protein